MDGYKKLKPKNKGAIIRDPVTKIPLSEEGELKPWVGSEGTYWRRRVDEDSCVFCIENPVIINTEDFDRKGGKK